MGLNALSDTPIVASGRQLINPGGAGSDNTSIWFVIWGPRATILLYLKSSAAGLFHKDMGASFGMRRMAWVCAGPDALVVIFESGTSGGVLSVSFATDHVTADVEQLICLATNLATVTVPLTGARMSVR